jgi:hypothetical protein
MKPNILCVERRALSDVWGRKKLLWVYLLGNAVLIALAYGWLWIGEETVLEVLFSAVLALAVIGGALWLHATALAAFHAEAGPLPVGLAWRRLPRFLPWAALAVVGVALAVWLSGYAPKVTPWLASLFTLRLRTPVSPQQVDWIYPALLRGLGVVAVLALLPLASQAAGGGFSKGDALQLAARPRYWLACAVLVLAGLYLPGRLVGWIPSFESLAAQAASLAVRFGLAYLLAATGALTLAAVIGQLAGEMGKGGNDNAKPAA